ncbi:MAG: hypothetical protein JWO69_1600, partial [Thermoleophilia bacterium]|nr:hypothetical protein [Thermoleophilia bacterium]
GQADVDRLAGDPDAQTKDDSAEDAQDDTKDEDAELPSDPERTDPDR